MHQIEKGERVHGAAGVVDKPGEQGGVQEHDQRKKPVGHGCIFLFQKTEQEIGDDFKGEDAGNNPVGEADFKKKEGDQHQENLGRHRAPTQMQQPGQGDSGRGAVFFFSAEIALLDDSVHGIASLFCETCMLWIAWEATHDAYHYSAGR